MNPWLYWTEFRFYKDSFSFIFLNMCFWEIQIAPRWPKIELGLVVV